MIDLATFGIQSTWLKSGDAGNKTLLAAFAHPDDESFGPGGTLARYARQGVDVHVCIVTDGAVGVVDETLLAASGCDTLADLRSGELIAQHDGQPGYGHLRTMIWQPGDLILDSHPLSVDAPDPATDALRIGLYRADTGTGLSAVNAQGEPIADWVEIGVILEAP